ncbi:glycoside hydrolase family 3 protein [Anaerosporobacter faecicola]|uniref:glycoside hydrolase family 3 protein n=1 Tax=Anaerosporobacter faecicola TaxID=2718714 RepID=UPI00143BCF42|nr:glycoside hydrolase family 3 protein [Anaerosporobacter faecicola]
MNKKYLKICLGMFLMLSLVGCNFSKKPANVNVDKNTNGSSEQRENAGNDFVEEDTDLQGDKEGDTEGDALNSGAEADGKKAENPTSQEKDTAQLGDGKIEQQIEEWIATHSIQEKVAQMFMITPEALTGYAQVTTAETATKDNIDKYPVGGIIYFKQNLIDPEQTTTMLNQTKKYYQAAGYATPFLMVDEEGGLVARIASNPNFGVNNFPPMSEIGATKDASKASEVGSTIGAYLSALGFNMNSAPDADVLSNASNTVIGNRSFGSDETLVSEMILAESNALQKEGVISIIKHFPGHGATVGDSHEGYAYTDKTIDELLDCELIPFIDAIEDGIQVIMVGHISVPNVTGDDLPSSLSKHMITEVLRGQLQYDGLIMTDAMNMGAITEKYSASTAAVMAIDAGNDIVLMPSNFQTAYAGVLDAVASGNLSEERINESVRRILRVKFGMDEGL